VAKFGFDTHISNCFVEDMAQFNKLADFVVSGKILSVSKNNASQTFSEIQLLLEHEVKFECKCSKDINGRKIFYGINALLCIFYVFTADEKSQ
jgi:hypothetical protein